MKHINWNTEKSLKLKESRGICFEDIVFYIERVIFWMTICIQTREDILSSG